MHCINDKVDTFIMLGMMVTSTNVIREVGVVVKTQQGWYDRTGSIQYPDIKSVLPRKYVKAINSITAPTELLSAKSVINRNSIHTGPEQDRLIPIKLQLGPGVAIIGGV